MKIGIEKILLLVFFIAMLFLGLGVLFDHRISHNFPFAYGASDAFQHQVRAEAIKDAGNFRYEATYISKGFEGVVGRYPPVIYHLAVILSYASGIEVYDSIYFIVTFFAIIASTVMYFIIRNFNKTVALLSLPLPLLIFSQPVSTGFLWGHWPSLLSQSFLILLFWSIMMINLKYSYILIAASLSATALTHTSETVFAFLFLALFFGIKLIVKKLNMGDIKKMAISLFIFFVIFFYYGIIFYNTWGKGQKYEFSIFPVWEGNPGFYITGFGLLLIPMVLGIVFSLPKLKDLHVSITLGFAMLLIGFMNYFGFEVRSFQLRFFWPIYLSIFLGFGFYILLKFIIKKDNSIYALIMFTILSVLLTGIIKFPILSQTDAQQIPSIPYLTRTTSSGIMDPFHWSALEWLSKNTEQDSKIYFFYGDIYSQDALLRNSKRVHYQVDIDDFVKSIQERKIKRLYISEIPGDSGGGMALRPSFFKLEDAYYTKPKEYFFGNQDVCAFDYIIFDKVSRQDVLAQYNLLVASELLKNSRISVVFDNEVAVILKNSDVGGDCIEERNF